MRFLARQLLIGLALICLIPLFARSNESWSFYKIGVEDGFTGQAFFCAQQDSLGRMWFGSESGLFVWDGIRMKSYSSIPHGAVALSGRRINDIAHLSSNSTFVASSEGVHHLNGRTEQFSVIPFGASDFVYFLTPHAQQYLWYGTNVGVYRYDLHSKKAERFSSLESPQSTRYIPDRYANCGIVDRQGSFVVGINDNLCFFDQAQDRFVNYPMPFGSLFPGNLILSLAQDPFLPDLYWVGSEQALLLWNKATQQAQVVMRGNPIKTIHYDSEYTLWLGTDNGLYYKKRGQSEFLLLRHQSDDNYSLPSNVVWDIYQDRSQNLWFATHNGISITSSTQLAQPQKISSITKDAEGNQIFAIAAHGSELMLGGTNGLVYYNQANGTARRLYTTAVANRRLTHNRIRHIYRDKQGLYWIASDKGINTYDPKSDQTNSYEIESPDARYSASWVYHITEHRDELYLSTCLGGVFVVSKSDLLAGQTVVRPMHHYSTHSHQALPSNVVVDLAFADSVSFWVATIDNGVCRVPLDQSLPVEAFNTRNGGLSNDVVKSIVALPYGQLVVATAQSIEIFGPDRTRRTIYQSKNQEINSAILISDRRLLVQTTKEVTMLDLTTGAYAQVNLFNLSLTTVHAIGCDPLSTNIYWGGIDLFGVIRPSDFYFSSRLPTPHINNFLLFGRLVRPNERYDGRIVLTTPLYEQSHVELSATQNSVRFEFSIFDYAPWKATSYQYRLLGYSPEWIVNPHGQNWVEFSNLPSGNYTLEVAVATPNTPEQEAIARLNFTIANPWYLTLWAWVVYCVIGCLLFVLTVRLLRYRHKLALERAEQLRSLKFSQMKVNFMTNIAHELKTPLSLISGRISSLIGQERNASTRDQLLSVHRNTQQIEQLVLQTLQNNHYNLGISGTLILQTVELNTYLSSVVELFLEQIELLDLSLKVHHTTDSIYVAIDPKQFQSVVENLLSNAIKFTPAGGLITLRTSIEADQLAQIEVSDTGSGILQEELSFVFDRFYQASNQKGRTKGHGLGLSISRDIVQAHNGTISVHSPANQGCRFTVQLPAIDAPEPILIETVSKNRGDKQYSVLVVEDNDEMREFIVKGLSGDFNCYQSSCAQDGFKIALEHRPSLILTDLMMSGMQGDAFTAKIRQNIYLAATPVIVLTAANDKRNEIESYASGADCFLGKPFDMNNLVLRIWQLIRKTELQQQKIRQEVISTPTHERVVSTDEKFLSKITEVIESQIEAPTLSALTLSQHCGIAPKQVYRKIKQLTAMTPTDYIRHIRLSRAALLFDQGGFSVSEVLYMVGFSNHSYFSKCFKGTYGVSPSEYFARQHPEQEKTGKNR